MRRGVRPRPSFGATRARLLAENLGDYAPSEVVAPRSDGVARTAKYQAALDGGHDVLVLISEVWGGFSPEAMRLLGELAQARNDGVDLQKSHLLKLLAITQYPANV